MEVDALIDEGYAALESGDPAGAEGCNQARSYLECAWARAWLALERPDDAVRMARQALEHDPVSQEAFWVLREVRGQRSEAASLYRFTVAGLSDKYDFLRIYEVAAESIEQALVLAQELETPSLTLDESEQIEPASDRLLGVYYRSGYVLCDPDAT